VEKAVGVKVRERLPDSVLAEADQIIDVDLASEDLRKRLEEGKIYPSERIEAAMTHFFKATNLETLRELTLRELASQIDLRRRDTGEPEAVGAPDQVMVCLSSRGPNAEKLLRYASRLAGKLNRNWYAVYVQTLTEAATAIDAQTQRLLADTLTLAKQLGAMVFTFRGEDVADTILKFAEEYRVGHIVIGRPTPKPFWKSLGRNSNVVKKLINQARGVTIIVLDTRESEQLALTQPSSGVAERTTLAEQVPQEQPQAGARLTLSRLISPARTVIWERSVSKEVLLRTLAEKAGTSVESTGMKIPYDGAALYSEVLKREERGSTFLNEGIALPHVRVKDLEAPLIALGLTRGGVSDVSTEKPVGVVFLILSPLRTPETQVQVLGLASKAAHNRHLLQNLASSKTPEEAVALISEWETSNK